MFSVIDSSVFLLEVLKWVLWFKPGLASQEYAIIQRDTQLDRDTLKKPADSSGTQSRLSSTKNKEKRVLNVNHKLH